MEQIWQNVAAADKDRKKSILLKGINDLSYLYMSGFVDVARYPLKEWVDSFHSSLQKDGNYLITYDQWMEKKKFRYDGPIEAPFQAEELETRDYTEAELLQVLTDQVIPNTTFGATAVSKVLNYLKSKAKPANGKLKMDKLLKQEINLLMDVYASPKRVRETTVAQMKKQKSTKPLASQLAAQKSDFAAGKAASKIVESRLADVLKETTSAEAEKSPKGPTISLKDLKKKRGPAGGRV